MKKISSSAFFYKKIFPGIWFSFTAFMVFITLKNGEDYLFVAMPVFVALIGYLAFKRYYWDLADEVIDEGSALLFKKGSLKQRVQLKDVINVDYNNTMSPERVVLHSRSEGDIGKELAFSPPARFLKTKKHPIIMDLIERIDKERAAS